MVILHRLHCLHRNACLQFGNTPRTAAYSLYGPGNYQLDIALVRSFPLHLSEASKFDFRAEMYNVTNHTFFGVASVAVGNASLWTGHPDTAATPQGCPALCSHRVLTV